MTEQQPAQQDIDELVRRLESGHYPLEHIREAGEILASVQTASAAYKMALGFWESPNPQVRSLAMGMMDAIGPQP